MTTVFLSCAAALGAAAGWGLVPHVADACLRKSFERHRAWWRESFAAFREARDADPRRVLSSTEKGTEGAIALWRDDALRRGLAGELTCEQVADLSEVGIKTEGFRDSGSEAQARERFRYHPRTAHRLGLALTGAVVFVGLGALSLTSMDMMEAEGADLGAVFGMTSAFAVCEAIAAVAMLAAIVADLRARIIPWGLCALVATMGLLARILLGDGAGIVAGAEFALMVGIVCVSANRVLRGRHPLGAVGGGDIRCMAALSLACGAGSLCGFAVCYVAAALFAGARFLLKHTTRHEGMPMAPFLGLWFVAGNAASFATLG